MRAVAAFLGASWIVFVVDAVAWKASVGAGAHIELLPLVSAFGSASLVGLLAGLIAFLLARAARSGGPARAWTIGALTLRAGLVRTLGAALLGLGVLAAGVPLRTRLLDRAPVAAAADLAVVVLAFALVAITLRRPGAAAVAPIAEGAPAAGSTFWARGRWGLVGFAALVLLAGASRRRDLVPSGLWDLWTIGSFALLALAGVLVLPADGLALRGRLARWARPAVLVAGVAAAAALGLFQLVPASREGIAEAARPSGWTLIAASGVDLDDDGYSAVFGGGDCDDLDPVRNPDAPEIPGNGVDENCRGGDRVAPSPFKARPTFVDLPPGARRPKHIVLISVDTLRADHMSAYGYERETTPRIDAWARQSWRYERSYSSAPYTHLAMPLILTGRYLSRIPWNRDTNPWGLTEGAPTIARLLADAGWATGGVATYRFFSDAVNWTEGFQEVDRSQVTPYEQEKISSSGPAVTRIGLEWMRRHQGDQSFLWMHYYDPHARYMRHPDVPDFGPLPIDAYDAEIWWTDREIGRFLDGLAEMGLDDDTAIALVGDHGELFGEHGVTFHGNAVWQELIHVPIILHVPGARPQVVSCPAAQIDLAPTLLNLAGVDGGRSGMDGATLLADANGCDHSREVLSELRYTLHSFRVLLGERYKLVNNVKTDTWQLFDIQDDPDETTNLRAAKADVFARMQRRMLQWAEHTASEEFAQALRDVVVRRVPRHVIHVGAHFENGIDLLAAELGDRTMTREKGLPIRFYWRLSHRVDPGCRVDLRFIDEHGRINRDMKRRYVPFNGLVPFDRVTPGKILRDARNQWLRGKRAGEFRVRVGLSCDDRGVPVSGGRRRIRGRFVDLGKVTATESASDSFNPSEAQ